MSSTTAGHLVPAESLRDRTLEFLRQAIVAGEVQSGELYSASALAKRLGVSASPVREAMLTLVNEGTMEAVRNRGFRLVPMSKHDLDEVFEMRVLLEVPVVEKLAERDLSHAMPGLRRRAEVILRAAEDGEANAFLAADREFHLAILELHGNRRLVNQVALLRDQTRLYGVPDLAQKGLLADSAAEHVAILDALEAGDGEAASGMMAQHLEHIQREWSEGNE